MRRFPENPYDRRRFLRQLGAASVTAAIPEHVFAMNAKDDAALSSKTVKSRAPLAEQTFYLLPLGSVMPAGWLRSQLEIQASGLSGHLDEVWADVGPNSGWLGGSGESWERGPYFMDGLVPLAWLLDDARLKAKAHRYVGWTLDHPGPNGMFGPHSNDDWWPRIVMLKALTQYQEATDDPRVIPLMERYFAYSASQLVARPLRDWGKYRWQDEVLSVLWLYNRTGDAKLLSLARRLQAQGYDWQQQFVDFAYKEPCTHEYLAARKAAGYQESDMQSHGVNNAMAIKVSPIRLLLSGSDEDRRAIFRQLDTLDRYHGLPNGMFSADEHFAGRNPSQGTELCTVVETMFSLEWALAILGDPVLGDRLERIAFNALPGTFTDDMWAHQYNQEPNQVECSLHKSPWTTDGPESNLYGLEPNFGCCTANFHQGWPKFAASLWMLSADDGLFAAAYAPCEVNTVVRDTSVRITEETEYPFREGIHLTVRAATPIMFPLKLRIPAWAHDATIRINGAAQPKPSAGSIAILNRVWGAEDKVDIVFAMQPRTSRWHNNSVAFERGSIVFSLPIDTDWLKLRDRGPASDWQVYPASAWNYAVADTDSQNLRCTEHPVGQSPFTIKVSPVRMDVKAQKLPAWVAEDGVATAVPQSPVTSDQAQETITLVPYGAARLRITAFPESKV